MNRKGIIGIVIAVPVVIVVGFALFLLGSANMLPGQTQPTRIPSVAPFSGINGTAPAGTTVAASTATTAPAAATTAPTAAPASSTAAAGSAPVTTRPAASTTASSTTAAGTSSSAAATAPAGSVAAKAPTGATTYAIVGDKSQAKITVNEKLAALPAPSDAVLTTNAMQGQIFLGPDTKPVEGAKIMVDLRTLQSDKAQRDNYIKTNTLQANQFPLAEYLITGVDGWTGPLTEGKSSTFKLLGMMTIHGVTKPITFDTTATMQGGTITGTATTNFTFEDFGLTPPNLSIVKADNKIKLDMNITAAKQQ